jgi:hypothetical protein
MKRLILFLLVLISCGKKPQPEILTKSVDTTAVEVTPEDAFEKTDSLFSYQEFYGIYDHESNTNGFGAVLSLRENGNNLYFTLSVAQGNCKKEVEGVVLILPSQDQFPAGFYQSDDCKLQFTFMKAETKVDVKEINFCGFEGCSYDGMYSKRRD